MKKILIISTSPRPNSNSHALAEEFALGAEKAGNDVEIVRLRDLHIKYCIGCMSCIQTGECVIKDDDAPMMTAKINDADVIVWATPIYFYEMSGQMKTMIDRTTPLYGRDYRFTDVYMLTSAESDEPMAPNRAIAGLQGWIDCFGRASLKGKVFAGGVQKPGEIKGHKALIEAYEMGKNI